MPDSQTISPDGVVFSGYHVSAAGANGLLAQCGAGPGHTTLRAIGSTKMVLPASETHYGFVAEGPLDIEAKACGVGFCIPAGFYFSIPGEAQLTPFHGATGFIVSAADHTGFLTMGWLEWMGRLRYIDGCTDSLLIPPIRMGDPCLNLLFFPPNTDQTMHTHPSDRIGMILGGLGECLTEDQYGRPASIPLVAGMLFIIHAGGRHKFRTGKQAMRVLAYHPDSDFGPTDLDHPMINRTMIDGVSANQITEIHTLVG